MTDLTLNDYQTRARYTAIYPGYSTPAGLVYCALKLAGEAGEVAENIGKALRDDDFDLKGVMGAGFTLTSERKEKIVKELGDVLWYVAMLADELGCDLDVVGKLNLIKLRNRQIHGTLQGEGDER